MRQSFFGRLSVCVRGATVCAGLLWLGTATAYGPQGHLIAGRAAAGFLCRAAVAEVGRLGGGDGLDELGLWADRVRGTAAFRHTGPWHYMNIADGASLAAYVSPAEGDILTALDRAYGQLRPGSAATRTEREQALRFLIHMLVDLHQPLHVGRAEDRGGNRIDVRVAGDRLNLHRLWDTEAITTGAQDVVSYARSIGDNIGPGLLDEPFDPRVWAAESLELRAAVYGCPGDGAALSSAYMEQSRAITRDRLTLAAGRLAATLNGLFCR